MTEPVEGQLPMFELRGEHGPEIVNLTGPGTIIPARESDPDTLADARNDLRERMQAGESVICPCCTQTAKIYTYSINHGMVQCLLVLARSGGWVHTPDDKFLSRYRGNLTKLQYWGLVERSMSRDDNGVGSGHWRITPDGMQYLQGWRTALKVSVFNGEVLAASPELGSVSDAWGEPFNLYAMLDTLPVQP